MGVAGEMGSLGEKLVPMVKLIMCVKTGTSFQRQFLGLKKYKSKYTVLTPSGRSALNLILSFNNIDRSKIVNI